MSIDMSEIIEQTSQRLKTVMKTKQLKQSDILKLCEAPAKQFHATITKSDISSYINNKYKPNKLKLFILAKGLDVSPEWLMGYNVPMSTSHPLQDEIINKIRSINDTEALEKITKIIDIIILNEK